MPYSNSGGTLTLPSPTHVHHVDVTSAVRSLRRSLSRSPSKFRLVAKSPTPSPQSPLSPSPPTRTIANPPGSGYSTPSHIPSPLAVPFPPSAKLALRSTTRAKVAPSRPNSRTRTSPRSPMQRMLGHASDAGNVTPLSSTASPGGQENNRSRSPIERKSLERPSKAQFYPDPDLMRPLNHTLSRLGAEASNDLSHATSSPLKRSDAIMNLDQASLGSPVAKRRSLHGSATFGHDFNVFDHGPALSQSHFDIHDDGSHEYELSATSLAPDVSTFTSMPRRSSSLRKSTLQQRHGEKTSWGRRHAAQVLAAQQMAQTAPEVSTPVVNKTRPRLSLDQFIPPPQRDSPFTSQGNLPNPSIPSVQQHSHQPHPLSRTMTTSSSHSSLVDESPTRIPAHFGEQPRPKIDFSKSLPVGSLRPFVFENPMKDGGSFATPQNYKAVKPLPAAFMSTGLISKVNRHPEQPSAIRDSLKGVPDTPCKKQVNGFATYPAPMPGSAIAKARHIRHSFGTPSTPFNPHGSQSSALAFSKGGNVFGDSFGQKGLCRRGSFLGLDGEESSGGSPEPNTDFHLGVDFEFPGTPTKQVLAQKCSGSPSDHRSLPVTVPTVDHARKRLSKSSVNHFEHIDFATRLSPGTPHESVQPPDPSGLTISNPRTQQDGASSSMLPPETPTTGREEFGKFGDRRLSTTPVNSSAPVEVEHCLLSRFEKVEVIGSGEFSQVFRVTQRHSSVFSAAQSFFNPTSSTPPTPIPERVFAVKKSRQPFQGAKDRQKKIQEVDILRALGQYDHVVHLIDSWEETNHLYIQTEFCEEGTLDLFLSNVGRRGRLDVFRIWKVLLEVGQGLRYIHETGFIHLDLKPANIFITFEGVLKIGDFGMATPWPAKSNIEGEGDRDYIAPEILQGQYDKPADVFALGIIMFEIAGNVKLPENGPSWLKLRRGDTSDVASLTLTDGPVVRDATGLPIDDSDVTMDMTLSDDEIDAEFGSPTLSTRKRYPSSSKSFSHDPSNLFSFARRGELHQPPAFMSDTHHPDALDALVQAMLKEHPQERPSIQQVLQSTGVSWVNSRRRAGATVFEGEWGPGDDVLSHDSEMIDA